MTTWKRWSSSRPASVATRSAAASTSPTLSMVEFSRNFHRPLPGALTGSRSAFAHAGSDCPACHKTLLAVSSLAAIVSSRGGAARKTSCVALHSTAGLIRIDMEPRTTTRVSLTALLGTPVTDAQGHLRGRLKDIAVATGPDAGKVAGLVLKTRAGLCIVPSEDVMETPAGTLELRTSGTMVPLKDEGNYLYLQQDLMDRQIIDVHGRKVVRVNDVDLEWLGRGAAHLLRVAEVEIGLRGAFRSIFNGIIPRATLDALSRKLPANGIPWQFVDVIEVDPARRVKLRIEYERLAEMHPSDLAEILEDL